MIKDQWISPKIDRARIMRLKHPLTSAGIRAFRRVIYCYYEARGRSFPWRDTLNPYHIIVSEVMLQQTQTDRVIQKYKNFIGRFPDFESLGKASVRDVLDEWIGLGYNRRALALQKAARMVVSQYDGRLPADEGLLLKLPGIGTYSAAAILAFAFNKPAVFVETNIRTLFAFFFGNEDMNDRQIMAFVEQTVDISNPREWYYALFDYGSMLKKWLPPSEKYKVRRSQPPFIGSDRQIRGTILKTLIGRASITDPDILRDIAADRDRVDRILGRLQQEGFIVRDGVRVKLAGE
jgi:A/G-specific adenine glycosylase